MTDCTQNRSEQRLVHEGTSQEQRFVPSLDPAFAPVDEHTIAHRTVFAQAYSAFLKYYDSNNAQAGDWKPFFGDDVSVLLAAAAVQDVDFYRQTVREYFRFLDDREHENKTNELRDQLDYLFSCCASLAIRLDLLHKKLPDEITLKGTLRNCIQSQLAPALNRLIAYHKGGEAIDKDQPNEKLKLFNDREKAALISILGETAVKFSALSEADLSKNWLWNTTETTWSAYYSSINENIAGYGDLSAVTVFKPINHLATHNLFTSIFDQFLKVYARIVNEAGQALEESLTKWDRHEPYYALFLAFLRLFEHARREMNTLTGRHLDFYYRDILRLREKEAEPGKAHLLLELAKQVTEHEVEAGELFKAGKDDLGKDVFFANDRTLVANRARVAALKTVFRYQPNEQELLALPESTENNKVSKKDVGRIYASPVADSADGLGAELTSEDQSWHPFFNKIYKDGKISQINMPKAELGFAIASHYLLMAGGKRTITLRFVGRPLTSPWTFSTLPSKVVFSKNQRDLRLSNTLRKERDSSLIASRSRNLTSPDYKNEIVCSLTGEEGWIEAKISKFDITTGELRIELSGAEPAVVPYSSKTHSYNFQTDLPILLVKLKNQYARTYAYDQLNSLELNRIDLDVNVKELKTLSVSNDFGPVDTAKPFQPFGASPVKNSALVIGSKEAFQKKLTTATIDVQWQKTPEPFKNKSVPVLIEFLKDGKWQLPVMTEGISKIKDSPKYQPEFTVGILKKQVDYQKKPLITDDYFHLTAEENAEQYIDEPDFSTQEFYNTSSRCGFVRLRLDSDFGQTEYENDLLDFINKVSGTEGQQMPRLRLGTFAETTDNNEEEKGELKKLAPPTGPFITEITLDYRTGKQSIKLNTREKTAFDTRPARFFHLTPFSQAEQHPFLNTTKKVFLLPRFYFLRDSTEEESESEFYIGISGLKPPQNLALLFQVADGTADPDLEKPDPHIHWSFLCNNEWIPLEENQVEDHTDRLLNSGIITFAIPRSATDSNTLLPSGMHWLRAAVSSAGDAVCRLRMVAAQALETTFTDRENDPAFPAKPLSPDTINKLARPHAAIKKVTQPFETFGGRGRETSRAFYTRISERLRHKDRAVALWDYERLVLEAFPQVFKVKCLNHTRFEPNETGSGIYMESAPGHVTLITIPDQQYHTLRDPLRPRVSLGLLEEIKAFLHKRSSCFIGSERLHVRNPLFEEVQLACSVRFFEGSDETLSKKMLHKAITGFLSPWAFSGGGSPSFGGKIYKAVLINFVEEQPYVDYVNEFKLFHNVNGVRQGGDKNEIEASKAVSILISARSHTIDPIQSAKAARLSEKCHCPT